MPGSATESATARRTDVGGRRGGNVEMGSRSAAFGRWLVLAGTLAGCAYNGAIAGRLEGRGMQPQPVTMNFTANRFEPGGKIAGRNHVAPSHFGRRFLSCCRVPCGRGSRARL